MNPTHSRFVTDPARLAALRRERFVSWPNPTWWQNTMSKPDPRDVSTWGRQCGNVDQGKSK